MAAIEETKLKFVEYIQPANLYSNSVYHADGTIERPNQQQPDLGMQNQVDTETVLRFGGTSNALTPDKRDCGKKFDERLPYEQSARPMSVPFGGRMVELCKERERNLDTSGYIRNGLMVSRGFGNVDEFSKLRFGATTRQANPPAEETEVDRIHPLNRNYGVVGGYSIPEDTRYVNKRYTNY